MRLVLSVAACLFVTAAVAQQSEVKVVAAEDIAAGTRKYEGKEIELRNVRCYYADVADYRCVTDARAVVFTESISNEDARTYIEEECNSVKKVFARSSKCVMNIKFVYQNVDHDTISGNERRTIVRPNSVEAILPRKKR